MSAIAFGTVPLGMDYGIPVPGEFDSPSAEESIRLLQQAAEAGINFFDTAPAYAESERLLGLALGHNGGCIIATKVPIPQLTDGRPLQKLLLRDAIEASLESSLMALRRDVLDIVQIHNPTVEVIADGEMVDVLLNAQKQGKVRFLGASVYTEEEALAIINSGCFDVLQVSYNVLDQRMGRRVFSVGEQSGMGIIVRSALLKGVLTRKAEWLPPELAELRQAAERAKDVLAGSWQSLPGEALRYCLSASQVATVLVGVRTVEELRHALAAEETGPLSGELLAKAPRLALAHEYLLNPSNWPVL